MDIKNLIPKNKHDIETAEKLMGYSYEEIKPIIPELLEWLQDMNWPVSGPIADYLETIADYISEDILSILRGNDAIWKYWTIIVFGPIIQSDEVIAEIKRIAHNPTKAEITEEVDEEARRVLALRNITF